MAGTTFTWMTTAASVWTLGTNWSPAGPPTPTDTAIVPFGDALVNSGTVGITDLSIGGSLTAPTPGKGTVAVTAGALFQASDAIAVWSGSTLSVDGASSVDIGTSVTAVAGAVVVESGHTLAGDGLVLASVVNNGTIEALGTVASNVFNAGTLEISGSVSGTGAVVLAGTNAILQFDSTVATSQTINFSTGSELILASPGTSFAAPITNLNTGDKIEFAGLQVKSASVTSSGTITVITNTGSYQLTNVSFVAGASQQLFTGTDGANGDGYIQVAPPFINWIGGSGNFASGANWQGGVTPNVSQSASLFNSPGTITGSGNVLSLNIGGAGTWVFHGATIAVAGQANPPVLQHGVGVGTNVVIDAGTTIGVAADFDIGAPDGATVTAQGGSQVTTHGDNVWGQAGQSGSLVVTGVGTTWTEQASGPVNGNYPGFLTVGYAGPSGGRSGSAGSVTITNGATVNTQSSGNLGFFAGATGAVTVSSSAAWNNNGINDGLGGSGTLVINNGTVTSKAFSSIGANAGAVGTATISGGGIWNAQALNVGGSGVGSLNVTSGTLSTTSGLTVGSNTGGEGSLVIQTGGTVTNNGTYSFVGAAGIGNLTVSGTGALLNGTAAFIVANSGVGYANVNGGGVINAGTQIAVGQLNQSDGTLVVGAGGIVTGTSIANVGNTSGSNGLIRILAGGTLALTGAVQTSRDVFGIGENGPGTDASGNPIAAANGIVLVEGASALLNTGGNGLFLGGSTGGTGGLTVAQGGSVAVASADSSVQAALSVANSSGDNATVTVTDPGSTLTADGFVLDGRGGTGSILVKNHASLVVNDSTANGSGIGIGAGRGAGPSNSTNAGGDGVAVVTSGGVLDLTSTKSGITVGGNGVNGALTVSNAGTVLAGTSMTVGTATSASGTIYGGTGELDIGASGVVRVNNPIAANGYDVFIGSANSSIGTSITGTATGADSGEVVVSGTGALLDANGFGIAVGWLSNGSLIVSQGGTVLAGSKNEALGSALSIGRRSIGGVTITDPGSNITADGVVYVARAGDGSLTIENHGTLTGLADTTGVAEISIGGSGPGSVTTTNGVTYTMIGGSGSALVTSSGYMFSLQTINVGTDGTEGTLTVDQGGTAEAGTQVIIGNSVSVAAGDTIITPVGSIISSGTVIGTTGVVNVGPGGLLKADGSGVAAGTPTMVIGADASSVGELNVTGAGALVTNSGGFVVGSNGEGSLLVQGGASVVTSAKATIAVSAGSDGSQASVTGAGSNWQVAGALDVGNVAPGSLNVTAGGSVSAASLEAGVQAGSDGVVSVTGTNTTLTTTGSLAVGEAGAGELSVLNGASVGVGGDLDVGQLAGGSGNVDIENATLTVAGNLNLGQGGGAGVVTVGTGATLTVTGGLIGGPDSQLNEFGIVDPNFDDGVNANVGVSGTQDFPGYIDGFATFTIDAGVTLTLESPSISGGTAFVLGGRRDTTGDTLVLNAGSVSADSTVAFSNTHGTLVLGNNALSQIDIQANDSAAATFVANPNLGMPTIDQFQATIDTFKAGDQIVVDTTGVATFSQDGAVINVIENGTTVGVLTFDTAANAQTAATTQGALVDSNTLCFCAGSLIGTPGGEVPVEHLSVGDTVLTWDGGPRPIAWIGVGKVLATRGRRSAATPVIVRKNALADNVPARDLHVTKGHSLLIDGVLIPVEFLVNHRSILWDDRAQEVTLYHVELDSHDVMVANGAPAESYRDDGNRWLFQNANSGWNLPSQSPCAPVLTGGPVVDAAWRRLVDRCSSRKNRPLTADPDLHLRVDGKRIDAMEQRDDMQVFRLGKRPRSVRICSRAAVPQELGIARDDRALGVAVRRIELAQPRRKCAIEADAVSLTDGYHAFEPDNGIRWTDGDAAVPAELFADVNGPCMLMLHLNGATQYLDDGVAVRVA